MISKKKVLVLTQYFVSPSEVFLYRQVIGITKLQVIVAAFYRMGNENYPFEPFFKLSTELLLIRLFNAFLKRVRMIEMWNGIEYRHNFKRILYKQLPDIIDIKGAWIGTRFIRDIEDSQTPVVVLFIGSDINCLHHYKRYYDKLKRLFRRADRLIFPSIFLMEKGISIGCKKEKSSVVYYGVKLPNEIQNLPNRKNKFQLLSVARLNEDKGHKYLLRAMRLLKDRGISIDLKLIGDGPLRDKIKENIRVLGLENNIVLLGALPSCQTLKYISACDALILASVRCKNGIEESFGIVLIEAGAYGKPVIASRIGGIPEIVEHEKTGLLIPEKEPDAIADAVEMLVRNPNNTMTMGIAGRKRVEEHFEENRQNAEYEKILLSVVNGY